MLFSQITKHFSVEKGKSKIWHEVQLKIDTGAKCNIMTLDLFRKVRDGEKIDSSKSVQLVAYGGHMFSTLGSVNMKCYVNSTVYNLDFQIVDKPAASLLGLKDSLKMDLIKLHVGP